MAVLQRALTRILRAVTLKVNLRKKMALFVERAPFLTHTRLSLVNGKVENSTDEVSAKRAMVTHIRAPGLMAF